MIAIYSSINLYAQLAIVAENRPKQTSPSISAGSVLDPSSGITERKSCVFFPRNVEFTLKSEPGSKIYWHTFSLDRRNFSVLTLMLLQIIRMLLPAASVILVAKKSVLGEKIFPKPKFSFSTKWYPGILETFLRPLSAPKRPQSHSKPPLPSRYLHRDFMVWVWVARVTKPRKCHKSQYFCKFDQNPCEII